MNRVVVTFDEQDLVRMISGKIDGSAMDEKDKRTIKATIRRLPAEGIKTIYTHLLNVGLKNLPDISQLIQHAQDNLT